MTEKGPVTSARRLNGRNHTCLNFRSASLRSSRGTLSGWYLSAARLYALPLIRFRLLVQILKKNYRRPAQVRAGNKCVYGERSQEESNQSLFVSLRMLVL